MPCMLFGQRQHGVNLGILVSRPMTNFSKAISTTLPKHEEKKINQLAVVKVTNFTDVMQGKRHGIVISIGKGLAGRVTSYRLKLESIIEIVVPRGRQNLPFRGHRDAAVSR